MLDNIVIGTVSKTHDEFSQKIAEFAGQEVDITDIVEPDKFSGGEFRPRFRTDIKGKNLYLIVTQGPWQDPLAMIGRTAIVSDAAKGLYGAKNVTAVLTDAPFSRQDKTWKDDEKFRGEARSAETTAKILHASGVDRILTMHMHSPKLYDIYSQVYGKEGREVIFDISPHFILAHYFMSGVSSLDTSNGGERVCFISPDKNASGFVDKLSKLMELPNATTVYFDKARKLANNPEAVEIDILNLDELKKIGFSFDGKFLIYTDDMIDTGGTLIKTREWIYALHTELNHGLGTPVGIYYYFTHPVLAGNNFPVIQDKLVKKLPAIEYITTNTRPFIANDQSYRFKERCSVLRVALLYADAIHNCCENDIHPDEHYKFHSLAELNKIIHQRGLYDVKRSSRHLMSRGMDMV